nr:RNA methyltransferase [Actinoalloteichus hoggarensis]
MARPGAVPAPFTERTPRVAAARRLTSRTGRERAARFLAEGSQAVREALDWAERDAGRVFELFATPEAAERHAEVWQRAGAAGVPTSLITEKAAAGLSETVTPQGLVAVCGLVDVPLTTALAGSPRLVAVLVEIADPGNAGTVLRVADAAGADAVIFAGAAVDPHNGKCVRTTTGSLFHLPVARERDVDVVVAACRDAGLRLVAADGRADQDLDAADRAGDLVAPTAWLFGSEAHGLSSEVRAGADTALAVPLHGRAESLNLATAAAVCLYATARAQRA